MADNSNIGARRRRALPILAGGLAVALGVVVVFGLMKREPALGPSSPPERIAAAFDKDMNSVPALAPWREEMQRDFPALYDQMRQTFVGHVQAGESRAEAMNSALAVIYGYRRLHQKAIPQASQDTLMALAALNRDGMTLMRRASDEVCARYVMTSTVQDGTPDQQLIIARRGAATFKAIHEGETSPVQREPLQPDELADFRAALAAKGLRPDLIEALFDNHMRQASAADQCKVGGDIVDALAALPAPTAAKITAALAANNS